MAKKAPPKAAARPTRFRCVGYWRRGDRQFAPGDTIELAGDEAVAALKRGSVVPIQAEPERAVVAAPEARTASDELVEQIDREELESDD